MNRGLGLGVALLATSAGAETPAPLELSWRAPASCPTESDVIEQIRAISGGAVGQDHHLRADATVTRTAQQYRLRLIIRAGTLVGERVIESASCEGLAGATAVTLALLLQSPDPLSEQDLRGGDLPPSSGGPDSEAPPPAAQEPAPPEPPAPPETAAPGEDTERSFRLLVQLPRVALDVGPLPRPSLGAGVALGLRADAWTVLVAGQLWLPQNIWAPDVPDHGAEVERLSAEVWGCRSLGWGALDLAPCLTLSLERLAGMGVGEDVSERSAHVLWLSGGAGGLVSWSALDWMALTLSAAARAQLSRPRVEIDGLGTLHQVAPFALSLNIATEWIW
ncbi:MAG TPA: hypothetical protein VKZ49_15240 [Polyangiaceae bacterium]|nr:hypothetical protein [Polyangiaceae bacterium]